MRWKRTNVLKLPAVAPRADQAPTSRKWPSTPLYERELYTFSASVMASSTRDTSVPTPCAASSFPPPCSRHEVSSYSTQERGDQTRLSTNNCRNGRAPRLGRKRPGKLCLGDKIEVHHLVLVRDAKEVDCLVEVLGLRCPGLHNLRTRNGSREPRAENGQRRRGGKRTLVLPLTSRRLIITDASGCSVKKAVTRSATWETIVSLSTTEERDLATHLLALLLLESASGVDDGLAHDLELLLENILSNDRDVQNREFLSRHPARQLTLVFSSKHKHRKHTDSNTLSALSFSLPSSLMIDLNLASVSLARWEA
jgi:hypothetical protein